jgi:response regulator RpfG family c-di-GMP phosphodiesterase
MKSLAALAEYRDKETGNHLRRICEYSRILGREVHRLQPYSFNISEDYVSDMYISSMLHDIGKVGVPDTVLLKPGPLSHGEWDTMKRHTEWGYVILNHADQELGEQSFLTLSSRIALFHHEKYDGSGYPRGLAGEEIPLSARISAIADVYDALRSKRPYKEAWSHQQAADELVKNGGRHFDPSLIEIFKQVNPEFDHIKHEFED